MKKVELKSTIAHLVRDYVTKRQKNEGLVFRVERTILYAYDNYCVDNGIRDMLCEESFRRYSDGDGVSLAQKGKRYRTLFNFYEYCRILDPKLAPIHRQVFFGKPTRCIAYIYTDEEVERLLDYVPSVHSGVPKHLRKGLAMRWKCIVGVLRATGLRISEVLKLKLEDVHRDERYLYVAKTKFRKERLVPVSRSVLDAIDRQLKARGENGCEFVFSTWNGRSLSYGAFNGIFNRAVRDLGIGGGVRKPRIHDLRHTFAVRTVQGWYRDGMDVNALLPVLSTYLGHAHLEDTAYYLESSSDILGAAIEHANLVMERSHEKHGQD